MAIATAPELLGCLGLTSEREIDLFRRGLVTTSFLGRRASGAWRSGEGPKRACGRAGAWRMQ
jgi:hypothetical protein